MLFNDFLLLTRLKRPLFTKVLQIINRSRFTHRREQQDLLPKTSLKQSNIDWFDSPNGDHFYLIVYKKVNIRKLKSFF